MHPNSDSGLGLVYVCYIPIPIFPLSCSLLLYFSNAQCPVLASDLSSQMPTYCKLTFIHHPFKTLFLQFNCLSWVVGGKQSSEASSY